MPADRKHPVEAIVGVALLGTLLTACGDRPLPVSPEAVARDHAEHVVAFSNGVPADYYQELASLRQAVAPFHNFEKAQEAGWDHQFTPCIMNPTGTAGMGYHYVNQGLLDGTLNVAEPEALLYEPDASGKLRLVAVEYLVPFTVVPSDQTPPTLYGLNFAPSAAFGVWGLHAWVWRNNPDGMHAPFNPLVSCAFAS